MDTYHVIHNGDGDTTVEQLTHEELTERLNEHYWGENVNVFKDFPADSDTNNWGCKVMIIKGELVHPKPVRTVTEWAM